MATSRITQQPKKIYGKVLTTKLRLVSEALSVVRQFVAGLCRGCWQPP
jgi:hypothetical protein